mgnify:FL=1
MSIKTRAVWIVAVLCAATVVVVLLAFGVSYILQSSTSMTGRWHRSVASFVCSDEPLDEESAKTVVVYPSKRMCESGIPAAWLAGILNLSASPPRERAAHLDRRAVVDGVLLVLEEETRTSNGGLRFVGITGAYWPVVRVHANPQFPGSSVYKYDSDGVMLVRCNDAPLYDAEKLAISLDAILSIYDIKIGIAVGHTLDDVKSVAISGIDSPRAVATRCNDNNTHQHSDLLSLYAARPDYLTRSGLTLSHVELINARIPPLACAYYLPIGICRILVERLATARALRPTKTTGDSAAHHFAHTTLDGALSYELGRM